MAKVFWGRLLAGFAALVLGLTGGAIAPCQGNDTERVVRAEAGMVVSASAHASQVGGQILRDGGNAVDAAVAVALALAVTWPEAGNLGGGGFMLICPSDGREPVCIDYRETAPATATAEMYAPDESTLTHRAVGVPGTVRGLALAHAQYGRLPWQRLVYPAADLARRGFAVDRHLADSINGVLSRAGPAPPARCVLRRHARRRTARRTTR